MQTKKPDPSSSGAGSQEPESFEATARGMFESALTLYAAERSLATREIRESVDFLVAHAQASGVQIEGMIIGLKRACHSSDFAGQYKSEVISRLVTMCIRRFYGADPELLEG